LKPDEVAFLVIVAEKPHDVSVRDVVNALNVAGKLNYKRAWFLLGKWRGKDWYDSGVTLDLGWLEPAGFDQAGQYGAVRNPKPVDKRPFYEQLGDVVKGMTGPRIVTPLWNDAAQRRYDAIVQILEQHGPR
jgi:hypothetical protein